MMGFVFSCVGIKSQVCQKCFHSNSSSSREMGSEMSNAAGCMFLNECAVCFSSCFIDSKIQYILRL